MQENNVNITLSIPASELSGLVPVDYKTITEKVLEEIDMSDLASDLKGYMDTESVEDKVTDMLESYDVMNGCETAKLATRVIIEAIRYDITTHLYGSDKSKVDSTMTSALRKFIQQEIARGRETYTFDQIGSVLDSIPELDFNTKFRIRTALTTMMYQEKVSSDDIIIKAD